MFVSEWLTWYAFHTPYHNRDYDIIVCIKQTKNLLTHTMVNKHLDTMVFTNHDAVLVPKATSVFQVTKTAQAIKIKRSCLFCNYEYRQDNQ